MSIFEDKIRKCLGLDTKKEELDHEIGLYREQEVNAINYSMAKRNIDISYLEEQLRQIERVINDNQFFIDAYETIKSLAKEKIKLGDSLIVADIKDKNGNLLARGNLATLESYQNSLSRTVSFDILKVYIEELGRAAEKMWYVYADLIISGKGLFRLGGTVNDDCYDIFTQYRLVVLKMQAGNLWNENREPVQLQGRGMDLISLIYDYAMGVNGVLVGVRQQIQISLDKLNSAQALDKYDLSVIEDTKKVLKSSPEYFRANASHELLERLEKFR